MLKFFLMLTLFSQISDNPRIDRPQGYFVLNGAGVPVFTADIAVKDAFDAQGLRLVAQNRLSRGSLQTEFVGVRDKTGADWMYIVIGLGDINVWEYYPTRAAALARHNAIVAGAR